MPGYVDWFVNREKQYQGFQKMLAGETPRSIMLVEAPADMGKTWLIQRMRHLCEEQKILTVWVNFRDRRAHDYLSLVRVARDQLGAEAFNHLTQTINNFTSVNINILGGGSSRGVNVGDLNLNAQGNANVTLQEVAGGSIIKDNVVRDNQFYIQADSDVARRAAEIQINDAFFSCLAEVLKKQPVVFLYDSFEDVTKEAEQWIRDYLLPHLAEGSLSRLIVIVAGRTVPQLDDIKQLVAKTGLTLFTEDHVKEYIQTKRKLTGLDLATIFKTSGGYPGLLAKMADVAAMDDDEDEDWL